MSSVELAKELSAGGAFVAWFIVVVLATACGFLFRELLKVYQAVTKEMIETLNKVNTAQTTNTLTLNMMLDMLQSIQMVFLQGRSKP